MITDDMLVPVGKLFKPHGYKGEMNVNFLYEKDIFEGSSVPLFIKIDNIPVPFFIEYLGGGADNASFLKLKGIDSDKEALKFNKKDLFALKDMIAEKLGVSETELDDALKGYKGYRIVDEESGELIGVADGTEEGIEYDYLLVSTKTDGEIVRIPLVEEFVKEIEMDENDGGGTIKVSLPEGFLDI